MKRKHIISLCLSMALSWAVLPAMAQDQTVTGKVLDDLGEPIIGATVTVAGTKTATVTDFDGNYKIAVPKGGKVTISYIGFLPQTVKPGGTVQLLEDKQSLEEVVVVGYGTQKMKNVTGAIETLTPKEIQDLSVGSLADALVGSVQWCRRHLQRQPTRPVTLAADSPECRIHQCDS